MAIILMSPPPIASLPKASRPSLATTHRRPNPSPAPTTAAPNPGPPGRPARPSPMAHPPTENWSGMMYRRASVSAMPRRMVRKRLPRTASGWTPHRLAIPAQMSATATSTAGYATPSRAPQRRHAPRTSTYPSTGTFSHHRTGDEQSGQRDPGDITDPPSGHLATHTFRNDPTQAPTTAARAVGNHPLTPLPPHRRVPARPGCPARPVPRRAPPRASAGTSGWIPPRPR